MGERHVALADHAAQRMGEVLDAERAAGLRLM